MAATAHRSITDELLAVAVQIKREAGISHAQIQAIIDRFASEQLWLERTGGIGFPLLQDIPPENRGTFMADLADLAPQVDNPVTSGSDRAVSVSAIWPSRSR